MTVDTAERLEFVVGGIQGLAQQVDDGSRPTGPGSRRTMADLLRYFADELQSLANEERR